LIRFCYLNTNGLKTSTAYFPNSGISRTPPKLFWARPKSEFGEHLATQTSNNVWNNTECVDDFWQHVAKFVFNVSNLLFFSSIYATDRHRKAVVKFKKCITPVWIASARPIFWLFSTLLWILIHTLETTGLNQLTNRCVKLRRQVGLFLYLLQIAEPWWKSIVASFSQIHNRFHTFRRPSGLNICRHERNFVVKCGGTAWCETNIVIRSMQKWRFIYRFPILFLEVFW